jgi:hypothetical protein
MCLVLKIIQIFIPSVKVKKIFIEKFDVSD